MSMNLHLIPVLTEAQMDTVATLADEIWHEHYSGLVSDGQINYMLEKFQSPRALKEAIEHEGYEYFLLYAGDDLVGYTGVLPHHPAGKLFLSKLYILKQHRKNGYSRQTVRALLHLAQKLSLKSLWLTVNKENSSIAAYRSLGFKKIDSIKKDIGNGYFMDDDVMELSATAPL